MIVVCLKQLKFWETKGVLCSAVDTIKFCIKPDFVLEFISNKKIGCSYKVLYGTFA